MQRVEPEREMVRRALPFLVSAVAVAFILGAAIRGFGAGSSAAIGAVVALANFVANGYSLAWAADTSPTFFGVVAATGFVVRMAVIVAMISVLNHFAFFSLGAFSLAVAPLTLLVLVLEMKLVAGPMGREIRIADDRVAA